MNKTKYSPGVADAYLTVAEVAELDRCSEKTVRRAIAAGLLTAVKIGPGDRLVRVTRKAHDAYRRRHLM